MQMVNIRVAEMRHVLGRDVDLMVDLHGPSWLPVIDAIAIGKALVPSSLLFLEDPGAPEDLGGWACVQPALPHTPVAWDERLDTKWAAMALRRDGVIDIIQPDIGYAGSIIEMRRIASSNETHFIQFAPHSGSLGPVAEFAATHLMASVRNALIIERLEPDWPGRNEVIRPVIETRDGHIVVPGAPGLGVELVEDAIAAHPSQRNVSIASGGWKDPEEHGSTYLAMRRRRAELLSARETAEAP